MPDAPLLGNDPAPASSTPPADPTAAAPAPAAPASTPAADPAAPKAPAAGAPEKYDLKLPEGVSLDDTTSTEFQAIAKEANLSQEAAQKLFDLGVKQQAKFAETIAAQTAEAQAKWANDSKADKEFGGEKLAENVAVAKKAMDAFASPELQAMLRPYDKDKNPNGASLGDHPEVIRLFYRIGKAMSEDRFVAGRQSSGANTDSRVLSYPNSKHN